MSDRSIEWSSISETHRQDECGACSRVHRTVPLGYWCRGRLWDSVGAPRGGAGLGSLPMPAVDDAAEDVDDLERLPERARIDAPHVLVERSFLRPVRWPTG